MIVPPTGVTSLTNDASFNDGTGIGDSAILPKHLLTGTGSTWVGATWTPTLTNHAGTANEARYLQVGKNVYFRIRVTLSGAASGVIQFSLPVTASGNETVGTGSALNVLGIGSILDAGTQRYDCVGVLQTTTTVQLYVLGAAGTYTNTTATSGTVPMTWANTDAYYLRGWYEAA